MPVPEDCRRVSEVLARAGDKWSALVAMMLGAGPMRLSALRRQSGGIPQRVLTLTLRGLERDGWAQRHLDRIEAARHRFDAAREGGAAETARDETMAAAS